MLILFCQGFKLNDQDGNPTGIVVCVAWQLGKEVGHSTKRLGPNASTSDTAYEAIILATNYIWDCLLKDKERGPTEIQLTDFNVARDGLKLGSCDHHEHTENLAVSLSNILKTHPLLQISLGWLPATKGSIPLHRLKSIIVKMACQGPTMSLLPPTKAQLHFTA